MITPFVAFSWIVLITSTYISVYYLLLYLEGHKTEEGPIEELPVTIVIPAYNEGEHIYRSLDSVNAIDYPRRKLKLIVIDDASSDNTTEEAKRFAREHPQMDVTIIRHKKNKGKAAALNTALRLAKTPYFITMDADSFVDKGTLKELLKFARVNAVVTPAIVPESRSKFLQRLQAVEYIYGNYLANILSGFDAQMVAPGPFSLFKTDVLKEIGGFDESSPTEDLEIIYRIRKAGYGVAMNFHAVVRTETPAGIGELLKQRRRWHLGFFDALEKHPRALIGRDEFAKQNVLKLVYFTLSVAFIILFFWGAWKLLIPYYRLLKAVGFDLLPFLKDFDLKIDLLGLDPQMIFYTGVMTVLTLFFLIVAFRTAEEKRVNPIDAIIFLMSYGFALSAATVMAVSSWIRRDYKW